MVHLVSILLGICVLLGSGSAALAASPKAAALRQANGLVAFTPPGKFLDSNFVADEMNPEVIFGTVKKFAASRKCPTAWLIEEGAKPQPAGGATQGQIQEYTVYLEEDCPERVIYYVFIDQSGLTPQQWIDWREKFHKSKTGEEFTAAKSKLEQACEAGCGVGAELRFIQKNGELMSQSPETYLRQNLKFAPIYDLNKRQQLSK